MAKLRIICLYLIFGFSSIFFFIIKSSERYGIKEVLAIVHDSFDNSDTNISTAGELHQKEEEKYLTNCRNKTLKQLVEDLFPNNTMDFAPNDAVNFFPNNSVTICTAGHKMCNVNLGCGLPCLTYFSIIAGYAGFFFVLSLFWIIVRLSSLKEVSYFLISYGAVTFAIILIMLDMDLVSENQSTLTNILIMMNYYYLVTYSWMSILSSNAFILCPRISRSFKYVNGRIIMAEFKDFFVNALILSLFYGVLSVFVSLIIPLPNVPDDENLCWVILDNSAMPFFSGPIIVLFLYNAFAFVVNIIPQSKTSQQPELKKARSEFFNTFVFFFPLSFLMYVLWIFGALLPGKYNPFWKLYMVVHISHGLFGFMTVHIFVTDLYKYDAIDMAFKFTKGIINFLHV